MSAIPSQMASSSSEKLRFDYLNLLVTQLRNQNPLDPMDNSQMASQLSQFAQLEQLEGMNTIFGKVLAATQVSQGAAMVGKEITFYSPEDGSVRTGRVEQVEFSNDEVWLIVGAHAVGLADLIAVGEGVPAAGSGGDSDGAGNDQQEVALTNDSQAAARGDYNGDGAVDARDLAILVANYGRTAAAGDFNRDGIVDVRDLAILGNNYGRSAAGGT